MSSKAIIDKKLQNYYIICPFAALLCTAICSIALAIAGIFNYSIFYISAIFGFSTICFCVALLSRIRMFCLYVNVENNKISLVRRKNQVLKQLDLDGVNVKITSVKFLQGFYTKETHECLIIYKNIELPKEIEYDSYWKDDNLIIIQNKTLIKEITPLLSNTRV